MVRIKPVRAFAVFFAAAIPFARGSQTAPVPDKTVIRIDRELSARLRWEILWNESPRSVRMPTGGLARLAVYLSWNSISYCSHDLGICVEYRLENHRIGRIGQRVSTTACDNNLPPCDDGKNDLESVNAFVHRPESEPVRSRTPESSIFGGNFAGVLRSPGVLAWATTAELGDRAEVLNHYRKLRPPSVEGLREWFRTGLKDAGYRSITVPCFESSDPEVFVYGDRPEKGPIIISVFWDTEREEWVEAGILERPEDREKIAKLRDQIRSIACATVTFE